MKCQICKRLRTPAGAGLRQIYGDDRIVCWPCMQEVTRVRDKLRKRGTPDPSNSDCLDGLTASLERREAKRWKKSLRKAKRRVELQRVRLYVMGILQSHAVAGGSEEAYRASRVIKRKLK